MKKISGEEYDNIFGHSKGTSTPLYSQLLEMKPGEAFILYKTERHVKYPSTSVMNRVSKKHKMSFSWKSLPDRSGWAFKRVK